MSTEFASFDPTTAQSNTSWREQDGIISFLFESDGTTGEEWINRLERKGLRVGRHVKRMLRSKDFRPTSGVTTEIAVLKGILFKDTERIPNMIRAFAAERKLEAPNAEVGCFICEKFSDKDIEAMGLWWVVVMHEPIKEYEDASHLLTVLPGTEGLSGILGAGFAEPAFSWERDLGFVFAVSQVSSQA